MDLKCEYCGTPIQHPADMIWLNDFPHHEDCGNALMDEIASESRDQFLYPDDPRGVR